MKFRSSVVASALISLSISSSSEAFVPSKHSSHVPSRAVLNGVAVDETVEQVASDTKIATLTSDIISKLRFREVQKELELRELDSSGTLSAMRNRLRAVTLGTAESPKNGIEATETLNIDQDALNEAFANRGIDFQDTSDPDFEYKELVKETLEKAERVHWKGATRKLRRLTRRFQDRTISEDVFMAVLEACMEDRLHGARAAESARKIMELMSDNGYEIPSDVANYCVKNCLGDGKDGTHDGFGGVDTALAMLAVFEQSPTPIGIDDDAYEKLVMAMAKAGSVDDSLHWLRELVVDKSLTPTLQVFGEVAKGCVSSDNVEDAEKVMTALAYAKAAGYELDNIASTQDGRTVLASGVIAAQKLDNIGLGLRFLTAASKAEGCDPDRGDALVATSSPAAQRACTIVHRAAIFKAAQDKSWQLAVKLLELMVARGLKPSPSVWRGVISCCAKAEKSRKATSLLLDWVELYKQGRADKPPLRIFNTVVNACEVCGEEDLTVKVLDSMQETHDTEGNLITFNIALKRLAKQGNTLACEGIIIGMLQSEIEPSVVTYTTAIAACATEPKKSDVAVEWIKRMRSRRVQPNVMTYNTAFASCLDGSLEGCTRGSQLASEMIADIRRQVESGILEMDEYTNIIPDFYTRTLAKQIMKQLKQNWDDGKIDKKVAKSTIRVPLLELVDFVNTDLAELAEKQKAFISGSTEKVDEEAVMDIEDEELEYSAAISSHRAAAV